MMQAQDFPLVSHSPKRWAAFVQSRTPILESIIPLNDNGQRNWKALGKDCVVAHARWRIGELGISGKKELNDEDKGLYSAIYRMKRDIPAIISEVGFESAVCERRDWKSMGEEEFVARVQAFMREKGISTKAGLREEDGGMYTMLLIREREEPGTIAKIGFEIRRRILKCWKSIEDDEFVSRVQAFMGQRGIRGKKDLEKADKSMYRELLKRENQRRGIVEKIGFEKKRRAERNWISIDDEAFASCAQALVMARGIRNKKEFQKADPGMAFEMDKREKRMPGIKAKIFSVVESGKHAEAVCGILDALGSFGDDK